MGYAADLTIVTNQSFTVSQQNHFAKHKATIYEGETFNHTIVATFKDGHCVYKAQDESIVYNM